MLLCEFKDDIAAYLSELRNTDMRTLADLIAFNEANADRELRWFGQEIFLQAEATGGTADPAYAEALATSKRLAQEGIDQTLDRFDLDAIFSLTASPPWTTDLVNGDHFLTRQLDPGGHRRLPQHHRARRLLVRRAPGRGQLHRPPLVRADPAQAGLRLRAGHPAPPRPPVPAHPRGQGVPPRDTNTRKGRRRRPPQGPGPQRPAPSRPAAARR